LRNSRAHIYKICAQLWNTPSSFMYLEFLHESSSDK